MSHHYKILTISALAVSLVTLTGCIVAPDKNNSYGSTGSYNQPQHAGSSHSAASGASEYDRGCADAKAGSYDRSGNAGKAYEEGWQACRNQGSAQSQDGVEAAKQACNSTFGGNGKVQTVTPVKPGVWEIILSDNYGRKVACTMGTEGTVIDWVEMKQ